MVPAAPSCWHSPPPGFVLLLAAPGADAHWEHHPTHFWLVLATALVNVVLGLAASEAAGAAGDARALLVSLAFLASAGFLALHALATPGSLVEGKNVGFVIATPVGLVLAAVLRGRLGGRPFAGPRGRWSSRHERLLRGAVLAAFAALGRRLARRSSGRSTGRSRRSSTAPSCCLVAVARRRCSTRFATVRYVRL